MLLDGVLRARSRRGRSPVQEASRNRASGASARARPRARSEARVPCAALRSRSAAGARRRRSRGRSRARRCRGPRPPRCAASAPRLLRLVARLHRRIVRPRTLRVRVRRTDAVRQRLCPQYAESPGGRKSARIEPRPACSYGAGPDPPRMRALPASAHKRRPSRSADESRHGARSAPDFHRSAVRRSLRALRALPRPRS